MRNRFVRGVVAGLIALSQFLVPQHAWAATTSCNTVAACIFGINTTTGIGVEGKSSTGVGIEGVSSTGYGVEGFSATNDGVVGHAAVNPTSPGSGKAGVSGYDDSKNDKPYNSGVYGVSTYSTGVQGRSTYGPAMLALSYKGDAITASAGTALYSGFTSTGVVAQSVNGDGMIAVGSTTGIVGFATLGCVIPGCTSPLQNEIPSGAAVTAGTDNGGLGLNIMTDTNPYLVQNSPSGVGATIDSGDIGMMITPDRSARGSPGLIVNGDMQPRDLDSAVQGAIVNGYNALSVTGTAVGIAVSAGTNAFSGVAIVAQGTTNGATLFEGDAVNGTTTSQLDDAGNLTIAGKLVETGSLATRLRNSDGTYSSADAARGYLVFLTPQGATTGLYVTGKSAAGFTVREIGNGHDSLAFDYRIVAHPYAELGSRLALVSGAIRAANNRKALFYRHLKPLRFRNARLDPTSLPVPSM